MIGPMTAMSTQQVLYQIPLSLVMGHRKCSHEESFYDFLGIHAQHPSSVTSGIGMILKSTEMSPISKPTYPKPERT